MPAQLQPIRRVRCTYEDCPASFNTDKEMKAHKLSVPEHDYCQKCDKDFPDYDAYVHHKTLDPYKHNKACRVCGEEFRSVPGLKRHIELRHKVNQELPCLGCKATFFSPSQMIEHLEYGHCHVISAQEFQGYIVHKHLIAEILKGGPAYERFVQKINLYRPTVDDDVEGGVDLLDTPSDHAPVGIDQAWEVLQPTKIDNTTLNKLEACENYPPLPPSSIATRSEFDLSSRFGDMALDDDTRSVAASSTVVGRRTPIAHEVSSVWANGSSAKTLFPHAQPTPAPSEWSIQEYDQQKQMTEGINILSTRFWDPLSDDWEPENFLEPVTQKFLCPFPCECSFDIPSDLSNHIISDHRIIRMRCPSCLKLFQSCSALVGHCASSTTKCRIRKADNFGTFLDRLTGGFLGVEEEIRPDHKDQQYTFVVENPYTKQPEKYQPTVATYLKYTSTKPAAFKEPESTIIIGGPSSERKNPLNG
ncbi:uncharacterized protein EI97DRAFT_431044 [Westerdykella ornata]|uniref:C2H2-type domain-containing protein n=1 Tax=Westerdykella ornata TaxID=318751 RepID=A0A6A6JSF1_WESOR|nr:uncharacterized protein EI97DRAFT_431044 [Westerdykella ornata]KAF2278798.1 hypothetical protein EI97DRAFT_431044 [Westerdykella ornata]